MAYFSFESPAAKLEIRCKECNTRKDIITMIVCPRCGMATKQGRPAAVNQACLECLLNPIFIKNFCVYCEVPIEAFMYTKQHGMPLEKVPFHQRFCSEQNGLGWPASPSAVDNSPTEAPQIHDLTTDCANASVDTGAFAQMSLN